MSEEPEVIPRDHEFLTDGTARNRCVYSYPDGRRCRRGYSAKLHHEQDARKVKAKRKGRGK